MLVLVDSKTCSDDQSILGASQLLSYESVPTKMSPGTTSDAFFQIKPLLERTKVDATYFNDKLKEIYSDKLPEIQDKMKNLGIKEEKYSDLNAIFLMKTHFHSYYFQL